MTTLNLEATTVTLATISTSEDRRAVSQVACDFDLYYNNGGMNEQAIAEYGDDELPSSDSDLPDYM